MKTKHSKDIKKIRDELSKDHKEKTEDMLKTATNKCNVEKAEFK